DATPRRIGEGSSPVFAPDGHSMAFVRGGQIFGAPLDRAGEPAALFQVRGTVGAPRFSPDGARLAFVSGRGPHTLVGLWERKTGPVSFMMPGVGYDSRPIWSPDGRHLVFLRTPGGRIEPPLEVEPERPFSIWTVDAQTGAGREVWASSDRSAGHAQNATRPALA